MGDSRLEGCGRTLYCVTNAKDQEHNRADSAADDTSADAQAGVARAQSEKTAKAQAPGEKPKLGGKAIRDVAIYGLMRLALFLVLTFVIHSVVILMGMAEFFPLLVSMLLALLIALPLSMLIFKKWRIRATQGLAEWDSGRRAHKQQMRRQLEERLDG